MVDNMNDLKSTNVFGLLQTPSPLNFPKNLFLHFLLEHLHGVDASGVFICLLLLNLT